jgi:hypothetical protein
MDAERGMTDLLNHAVATIEPRTGVLVSGATTRGRVLRRRRRIAQVGSGAALVGLIAGVAVAVWPSSDGAAPSVSQHRAPAASKTVASKLPKPADDGTTTITPQVLLQRTLALLPSDATTSTYTGRSFAGWVGAEFVYDDGAGAAQFDVSIGFVQDGISGEQKPCASPGVDCHLLGDGSRLMVFQGPEFSQGHEPYDATEWSVDLVRTDGVEVSLSEWNSKQEKDGPITRANPPLTIDQLTAIARSPQLTPQVSSRTVANAAPLFHPHPVITQRKLEREAAAVAQARAERAAARSERAQARAKEREHRRGRTHHSHG